MKPDRYAIYCDVDGVDSDGLARMIGLFLGWLEDSITLAVPTGEIEWLADQDGTVQEGRSTTVRGVAGAATAGVERKLYVSVSTKTKIHSETFAELDIAPSARGEGTSYEAFLQIMFPGVLLERNQSQPFEELFTLRLQELVSRHPGCTQAFVSDDLDLDGLPIEKALKRARQLTQATSSTTLRNLSWLMFLNESMSARLEDVQLTTHRSWTAPSGGMVLQFTDSLEDFVGQPVLTAWHELVPLMPTTERPMRPSRHASRTVSALLEAPGK